MRALVIAIFVFLTALVGGTPAMASGDWVASQVRQPAHFTTDNRTWRKIRRGMRMPRTSWINTGRGGRLVLRRRGELIQYRPNTLAGLSSKGKRKTKTFMRAERGDVVLDVKVRNHKHVTVKTPYLAAVVKGTRFSVSVRDGASSVSVDRGTVNVRSNSGGRSVDVRSGQSVQASRASGGQLTGTAVRASSQPATRRTQQVAPAPAKRGFWNTLMRGGTRNSGGGNSTFAASSGRGADDMQSVGAATTSRNAAPAARSVSRSVASAPAAASGGSFSAPASVSANSGGGAVSAPSNASGATGNSSAGGNTSSGGNNSGGGSTASSNGSGGSTNSGSNSGSSGGGTGVSASVGGGGVSVSVGGNNGNGNGNGNSNSFGQQGAGSGNNGNGNGKASNGNHNN